MKATTGGICMAVTLFQRPSLGVGGTAGGLSQDLRFKSIKVTIPGDPW